MVDPKHILISFVVILLVPLIGIHSYISVVQARSGWEIRAEAQFEFAKFVERLHKETELKDPQKFIEYKSVILRLVPDFRQTADRLDPMVKVEFCKLASTSSEFPLDCTSLDQRLPLPTPQTDPIGNSSNPCLAPQTDRNLTELEINTLQIHCNDKNFSDFTKLDNQRRVEISKDSDPERAKERLNVGCDALQLLSNTTQDMLKSMNKDVGSCFSNASSRS